WSIEAILLSVSDRRAVRGVRVSEKDIDHHLGLARGLMEQAFTREETRPPPALLSGDELMRDLGIGPGPTVGELLDQIQNEQELGNIASREQALHLARKLASGN
ncbi:MAG: polynucleotide adenylyltransferase, partial [Actinomycetota bacterium]